MFKKINVNEEKAVTKTAVVWTTARIEDYLMRYSEGEIIPGLLPFIDDDIGKKAPNLAFKLTAEEIEEFKLCMKDVDYFADGYAHSMTDDGIMKLKLRNYQRNVLREFQANRYIALLASRQVGKTVTSAIFIVWYICFNIDRNVLILANKGDTAKEIMEKIKDVYDRIPYFLKPGIKVNNVNTLYFDNGCKIFAETTTKSSGRGKTVHLLYADEFAFIPDNVAEEFYASIYPTLSSSSVAKMIFTSTPNGKNLFHDLYFGGVDGTNEYKSIRIDWWEVPGRDEEWKRKEIANLGQEKFDREYGLNFFIGSSMLLSEEQIERLKKGSVEYQSRKIPELDDLGLNYSNLKWHPDFDFDFSDKKFLVSVDIADGAGRDSTVINIFQVKLMPMDKIQAVKNPTQDSDFFYLEQIGVFRDNRMSIENVASIFSEIVVNYLGIDNTKAIVEVNFKGDYFISRVLNDPKNMDEIQEDIFVHTKHTKDAKKKKPGVRIKRDNKEIFCTTFKSLEQRSRIAVNEKVTCEELINFQKNNASYSAEVYHHDDLAMSCINICPYMIDFDIDGSPAGEDFLYQVEELYDSIDEDVKKKMQERIFATLDTQEDFESTIDANFSIFDPGFVPELPEVMRNFT